MDWINSFELMCYVITALLLVGIFLRKRWTELRLFCSAALAGFALELLAVRVTGIYHYSPQFWISLGTPPYQFPFFGGLMWGGLTICGLRITDKLGLSRLMTALVTGWLIVSMDLLLDVAAIRLDSGFWVWEGREITLDVNHHMFMSVIWVNFLGYLFETPAVVFFHRWTEERGTKRSPGRIITDTVLVGLGGIAVVGAASGLSLWLNSITDEWFACVAFMALWCVILVSLLIAVAKNRRHLTLKAKKDIPVIIFWAAMYGYCLAALWSLGILLAVPLYGVLAVALTVGTLMLSYIQKRELAV